jgi:hypothetical protein
VRSQRGDRRPRRVEPETIEKRSSGRIDGLVALAMAIGVAPLTPSRIDICALIG